MLRCTMQLATEVSMRRRRQGGALLVALALLALGAALLAGTSAAARSSARAESSREAQVLAGAEVRVALAEFMTGWSGAHDALSVGSELIDTVGPRQRGFGGAIVQTRVRLRRLTTARFVLAADCQVGPDDAVQARRRAYLLLERGLQIDSTAPILPPVPITRWGLADLY
jgi:type II secretory pathway component PulK